MNLHLISNKVEVASDSIDRSSYARYEGLNHASHEHGLDTRVSNGVRVVRTIYRNQALLERYLSGRRLGRRSRDSYLNALRCFTRAVGVPIEEAGEPELGEWYRRASSRGLAASTIILYSFHLGKLLEFAAMSRGLSRREAETRAGEIMEAVPLADLRREARVRIPGRDKLVTPEELRALREEAVHPRARAIISVLYESGCRKGELLSLRIRDLSIDQNYAEIRVLGKTGERTIPLVRSVPVLRAWLEAHPDPRGNAPLFATVVSGEVRRMESHTPNHLLRDLCRRAGLRHIHPHMLRHTRLTELARKGLGEYQLKSFAGWTPNSPMAARYIHLSGRAHIPAVLAAEGVIDR